MEESASIRQAIAALEAQRATLGDAVIEIALAPLLSRLAELESPPADLQPAPGRERPLAEQRKLVTILFSDLVGFTALAERRDPEEVREILAAYFERWSACIQEHNGIVEKYIGDAVMAVFGLSAAREDDPENAVRAALAMRLSLDDLNQELEQAYGLRLKMRVGIHTGLALVSLLGEGQERSDGQDFGVVGDTVNLASRLQSVAPEGGILISHDTFRLVRGIFNFQALEPVKVRGKQRLVQVYLVQEAKPRAFRMETRGVEGVETPMVGRQAELQRLQKALVSAYDERQAHLITVVGEAGIGKSRLVAEFDVWIELYPQLIRYFKARAAPAMQNQPYSLLRELFSFRFQIQDSDPPAVVQEKLLAGLAEVLLPAPLPPAAAEGQDVLALKDADQDLKVADLHSKVAFIGQLLGFNFERSPYLKEALNDPRQLRDRALAYLNEYFKVLASIRPIAILLEDLHWADDSSLEAIERLVAGMARERLLVVGTARPALFERKPAWGEAVPGEAPGSPRQERITLHHLSEAESRQLVREILQKMEAIPPALHNLVVKNADGNPFYMEELVRMFIEDGVIVQEDDEHWRVNLDQLAETHIPPTLTELLQARFDSLTQEERVLLQRASIIGRIFWDEAVEFLEEGSPDGWPIIPQLDLVLQHLSSREMIFPREWSAFENTREFFFKHALLRDVTYESVLKRLRKIYHAHAARWLVTVTQRSRRSDEYAALIAEHYDRAEELVEAAAWYQRAAKQAADQFANVEALRLYTRCLELWPAGDLLGYYQLLLAREKLYDLLAERQAQRKDIESLLELAEKLDARQIADAGQPVSWQARVYMELARYYDTTSEFPILIEAAEQGVQLAHAAGDQEAEATGYLYQGIGNWRQSNFETALPFTEKALLLAKAGGWARLQGDCLRNVGVILNYQGRLKPARENFEAALRIYAEIGYRRGEAQSLNSLGAISIDQGQYRRAMDYVEQALRLKRLLGDRRSEIISLHNLGVIADRCGDYAQARAYLEQVLAFCQETGDLEGVGEALEALGGVNLHLGDFATASDQLEQALQIIRTFGDRLTEAHALGFFALLYHYRGENEAALGFALQADAFDQEVSLRPYHTNHAIYLGHILLGLERLDEARTAYQQAYEICGQTGEENLRAEASAGLACIDLEAGDGEQALARVEALLLHMNRTQETPLENTPLDGMDDPLRVWLTCYQVLLADQDPRAQKVLTQAKRWLKDQAARLEDEVLRRDFLENIPSHRALRALQQEE